MTLLDEIAHQHSETMRRIYERRGRTSPTLWAQSIDRMIIASPKDRKSLEETNDEFRGTLAVAMACRIDALAIGRCDEGFIHTGKPKYLNAGDLVRIADLDPEVRTCVITEAVAVGGSEEVTIVAVHGIDDYGQSTWDVRESHNSTRTTLVPLQAARSVIDGGLSDYWRDRHALDQFVGQFGWELQTFPEHAE